MQVGGEYHALRRGQLEQPGDVPLRGGHHGVEHRPPFGVDPARGIIPGLQLGIARDIRPGMVAMGGKVQPLGVGQKTGEGSGIHALRKHESIRTAKTEPVFPRAQAERVPRGHSRSANDSNASGTYSDGPRPARRAKRMAALRNAEPRKNRPALSRLRLQTGQPVAARAAQSRPRSCDTAGQTSPYDWMP